MNGRHSSVITKAEAGQTLAAVVRRRLNVSWSAARRVIEARRVLLGQGVCADPTRRVAAGQRLEIQDASRSARGEGQRARGKTGRPCPSSLAPHPSLAIVHVDDDVVVVNKPAGLTTMRHPEEAAEFGARGRQFLPPTLADLLPPLLPGPRRVIPVHRLDKETSGLVVFARTPEAARHLGQQLRRHSVERRYLALVRGQAGEGRIESWLVRDRGDGRRGSSAQPGEGQRAVTHVRVVERLVGFTLVECRLETGRTHQVRIHLGEAGTPLCGDHVYDRPLHGRPLPDESGAKRIMLHAASLGFDHPTTGEWLLWTAPLPEDMAALLDHLRGPRHA